MKEQFTRRRDLIPSEIEGSVLDYFRCGCATNLGRSEAALRPLMLSGDTFIFAHHIGVFLARTTRPVLRYNNCEENICAYTLENFLVLTYSDDMTDANGNDLQDSGHI